ncbi:MAG: hypothetical protein A2Z43_07030 [Syntrophobacterales bacterium RBG_19FT_COMBO_59_10]|nr:MAG: hypothetical protein A2Z43_07030 [Syntrophobacterales bacterium RBG_19FT_COMBO_59_10]
MRIELNLFASLARYVSREAGRFTGEIEVGKGVTILQLLRSLNLPMEKVKLIFLNGVHARGDEVLQEGDRVGVFPPVAGG